MTTAVLGVFVLIHFDASWHWWAGMLLMAFIDQWVLDERWKQLFRVLSGLQSQISNLHYREDRED